MADGSILRGLIWDDIRSVSSFANSYPVWSAEAANLSGGFSDGSRILNLGSHLRDIFLQTRGEGRESESSQSQVARAGAGWECLVVWYLNLVFHGSRAVAVRKKSNFIPDCILDAVAVTYGNYQTNSESDVIVIAAPSELAGFDWTVGGCINEKFFASNIHKLCVGIVQCKTNWNENSQIPMLWDIVYKQVHSQGSLSVGRNGFSIHDFQKFTYSFATVPTQKGSRIPGLQSVHTKRVRHLSGGNYWGMPTANDVALSLKEIFTRNFAVAFNSNVPASIAAGLACGNPFISE